MKNCGSWTVGCAGLLMFTLVASLAAAPVPADPRKTGTVRMAALLDQLAGKSRPMNNPFLSRERVAAMRAAMAANPATSDSPEMLFNLGTELLNAGENEKALETFDQLERTSRTKGQWQGKDQQNAQLNQALCHLRMAEQRNCLSNHNADSCLVPIQGGGIHLWPDGSRRAIGVLTNLLEQHPETLAGRWLLNIGAMTVGDYPAKVPARWLIPPGAFQSDYDIKRFIDVAGPAGLGANELSGGSVTEDFDGDGLLDVMVTSIGLRDQMHFYRNNGDGTFSDRTREAGLIGLTGGLNLITGDYNNDGRVDVFVLRGAWMKEEGKFPIRC